MGHFIGIFEEKQIFFGLSYYIVASFTDIFNQNFNLLLLRLSNLNKFSCLDCAVDVLFFGDYGTDRFLAETFLML
jgi:hypothetical protein